MGQHPVIIFTGFGAYNVHPYLCDGQNLCDNCCFGRNIGDMFAMNLRGSGSSYKSYYDWYSQITLEHYAEDIHAVIGEIHVKGYEDVYVLSEYDCYPAICWVNSPKRTEVRESTHGTKQNTTTREHRC